MNKIIIRKEKEEDYDQTELMAMRAFWNLHGPGCSEHYLVHLIRESESYLPEISRVAEMDGKIVGTIMYTQAIVQDGDIEHEVITFGPLCIEPTAQSYGIGGMLLRETIKLAKEAGYPGICFFGEPDYYPKHGFITCDHFGITDWNGKNSKAFMGMELQENGFTNICGRFREDPSFEECENEEKLEEYNKRFPDYPKLKLSCQWLHKQRLGKISKVEKDNFIIQYWEEEIPAKLCEAFELVNKECPMIGDYVTFDYYQNGDSKIISLCEKIR